MSSFLNEHLTLCPLSKICYKRIHTIRSIFPISTKLFFYGEIYCKIDFKISFALEASKRKQNLYSGLHSKTMTASINRSSNFKWNICLDWLIFTVCSSQERYPPISSSIWLLFIAPPCNSNMLFNTDASPTVNQTALNLSCPTKQILIIFFLNRRNNNWRLPSSTSEDFVSLKTRITDESFQFLI